MSIIITYSRDDEDIDSITTIDPISSGSLLPPGTRVKSWHTDAGSIGTVIACDEDSTVVLWSASAPPIESLTLRCNRQMCQEIDNDLFAILANIHMSQSL